MAKVRINGDTSGYIELASPAAAGSNTITLPSSNGSANQLLKNSGTAGTLAWSTLTEDSSGNLNVDSGTLYVDASNNRVGVNTNAPGDRFHVVGPSGGISARFSDSVNATVAISHYSPGTSKISDYGGNYGFEFATASLNFLTAGSERARIDNSGRLLVNISSSSTTDNDANSPIFQVEGIGGDPSRILVRGNMGTTANNGPVIYISRSRGTTANSKTAVVQDDLLGSLIFEGTDGTADRRAAAISAAVDATPGTNDMPGRLVFSTTPDGAANFSERARITSGGFFKASNTGAYQGATGTYHEFRTDLDDQCLYLQGSNGAWNNHLILGRATQAASSNYKFILFQSGNGADTEFNLRGDGNAFADGTWSGGGADYAEYFEWSDGNPNEEDRRGISVVLDGDQIRPAIDGEDPIGVISGNPSVVGDAAWNKWSGKYLRDEYGTYIQEDYEVVNDKGEIVIQQRRKLNPAYDPDQEYVNREDRPEWDCVGLMGKLRIRKGQPTGSRWIKMRDISNSVEEWLVR